MLQKAQKVVRIFSCRLRTSVILSIHFNYQRLSLLDDTLLFFERRGATAFVLLVNQKYKFTSQLFRITFYMFLEFLLLLFLTHPCEVRCRLVLSKHAYLNDLPLTKIGRIRFYFRILWCQKKIKIVFLSFFNSQSDLILL